MKIFAHRGWSAGETENTLLAFRESANKKLDGVEFDVRYGIDGKTVVCAHDLIIHHDAPTLNDALQFLASTNLELLIEFKEYTDAFYGEVVKLIRQYGLVDRTTIFGFVHQAKLFQWGNRGDIKLGIIAEYPKDIKRYISAYNPNMVLLGWGTKIEKMKFRIAWTFLSLKKTFGKYPSVRFVIGVAYTDADKKWLSKQTGLYGATADMPLL